MPLKWGRARWSPKVITFYSQVCFKGATEYFIRAIFLAFFIAFQNES